MIVRIRILKKGWRVEWSGQGSIDDILKRWAGKTLKEVLHERANVDLMERRGLLNARAELLRHALTKAPLDPANASAPVSASQLVIELKRDRHRLNVDLNGMRNQQEQGSELVLNFEHRIHAATDLLRLKKVGVGRLEHMECPTCHRDIDPATFALTEQSESSISAHIESLKRDRELVQKNLQAITQIVQVTRGALSEIDSKLHEAERALITVTEAVGTVREQIADTAAGLAAVEREIDRVTETAAELDTLQDDINRWVAEAGTLTQLDLRITDLGARRATFRQALQNYTKALGHSALTEFAGEVELDDQYTPYLNQHRLRSLGSASDKSRLVAAYALALAAASGALTGLHPGLVILDEPLQQNPDEPHRELFLAFLSQELARQARFQTIIFTWLQPDVIDRLRDLGTNVVTPEGEHFLKLIPAKKSVGPAAVPAIEASVQPSLETISPPEADPAVDES